MKNLDFKISFLLLAMQNYLAFALVSAFLSPEYLPQLVSFPLPMCLFNYDFLILTMWI